MQQQEVSGDSFEQERGYQSREIYFAQDPPQEEFSGEEFSRYATPEESMLSGEKLVIRPARRQLGIRAAFGAALLLIVIGLSLWISYAAPAVPGPLQAYPIHPGYHGQGFHKDPPDWPHGPDFPNGGPGK